MAARDVSNEAVAEAVEASVRTVGNWRKVEGGTMPSDRDRAKLRILFPGYDAPGDSVELAVRGSTLTEDRQYELLGTYKRLLREQGEGKAG